jgi:DNA-binding protein YbaB
MLDKKWIRIGMSMRIEFDQDTLRPLVHLAVAEALSRMEEERADA